MKHPFVFMLIALVAAPLWRSSACSHDFQDYLLYGGRDLLRMPEASFDSECLEILGGEQAGELAPSERRDAVVLHHQSVETDLAEFAEAILDLPNAEALAADYTGLRHALSTHAMPLIQEASSHFYGYGGLEHLDLLDQRPGRPPASTVRPVLSRDHLVHTAGGICHIPAWGGCLLCLGLELRRSAFQVRPGLARGIAALSKHLGRVHAGQDFDQHGPRPGDILLRANPFACGGRICRLVALGLCQHWMASPRGNAVRELRGRPAQVRQYRNPAVSLSSNRLRKGPVGRVRGSRNGGGRTLQAPPDRLARGSPSRTRKGQEVARCTERLPPGRHRH